MKKYYILFVALFFGVGAIAQTHNVTFRVDLDSSAANGTGVFAHAKSIPRLVSQG